MKATIQISLILTVLVLMISCLDAPEYSIIPKIKFKRLEFVDVDGFSDSLNLTFDFEDGDGDIGLADNELWGPFIPYFNVVFYDSTKVNRSSNGNVISIGGYQEVTEDGEAYPPFFLADNQTDNQFVFTEFIFSEYDNRSELSCLDYLTVAQNDSISLNYYIVRNEFHNNLYVNYFKKKNGEYFETTIDEDIANECNRVPLNLRFPIFDPERLGKPTVGSITYFNVSRGLVNFLANDTFKIQFYIYDRALNKSNIVETGDFLLEDIAK